MRRLSGNAALLLGILGISLIALGHRTPLPTELKACCAVLTVLVVPGLGVARLWPRLRDQGAAVHVAMSTPLSLLLLSVPVAVHAVVSLSPITLVSIHFLLTFIVLVWASQVSGRPRPETVPWAFWVLGLAMVALCLWGRGPVSPYTDGPIHLSTVREILNTQTLFPLQGLIPPETVDRSDPRMGLFHVALALVAAAGDVDPTTIWIFLPGLLSFGVFAMTYTLGRWLLMDSRAAMVGAVLTCLCMGGEGARWILHIGYGGHIGLWIAWAALLTLGAFLRTGARSLMILFVLLVVVGEGVHPLSPVFVFVPAGVMGILAWRKSGREALPLVGALAFALAAAAPVLILRLGQTQGPINPLHQVSMPTLLWGSGLSTLWPGMVLQQLGWLGCLGLLLTPVVWKRIPSGWGRRFLVGATLGPLFLTMVPGVFDVAAALTSSFPIKSLFLVPAFLVLAQGMFHSRVSFVLLSLLGVLAVVEAAPRFHPDRGRLGRTEGMEQVIASLKKMTPGRTVVADPWLSCLIAAETDHYPITVLGQHGHPMDFLGPRRLDDINTVFSRYCSGEQINRVLEFYGDPLVAVAQEDSAPRRAYGFVGGGELDRIRTRTLQYRGMVQKEPGVFSRDRGMPGDFPEPWDRRWKLDPPGTPVDVSLRGLHIERIEVPPEVTPGERTDFVLWWSQDGSYRGAAVEAHLRLESEEFTSRFKPARKIREAFLGEPLSRVRAVQIPFRGTWPAACWPETGAVSDTLSWWIPKTLPQGSYLLRLKLLEQEITPRIHIRDVLSESDRWQGPQVGKVRVLRR